MAVLAYLFAIVPLWGVLAAFMIWMAYRDTNRKVVYHAHQALSLHFLMLMVFVLFSIFLLVVRVLRMVDPRLAEWLSAGNYYALIGAFVIYCLACLLAAIKVLGGKADFEIPLIGRILKNSNNDYR